MRRLELPLTKNIRKKLRAGESILLSGRIYTARDQAHRRLCESIRKGRRPPINLKDSILYYCGPTPARRGEIIGSCGPTTAKRMDRFTPPLLAKGLAAMIGKGSRSKQIEAAIRRYGCVYFIAIGGAGAYLANRVKSARVIAYKDLGPEAIYEFQVEDFPAIVAIDSKGDNIYRVGGV